MGRLSTSLGCPAMMLMLTMRMGRSELLWNREWEVAEGMELEESIRSNRCALPEQFKEKCFSLGGCCINDRCRSAADCDQSDPGWRDESAVLGTLKKCTMPSVFLHKCYMLGGCCDGSECKPAKMCAAIEAAQKHLYPAYCAMPPALEQKCKQEGGCCDGTKCKAGGNCLQSALGSHCSLPSNFAKKCTEDGGCCEGMKCKKAGTCKARKEAVTVPGIGCSMPLPLQQQCDDINGCCVGNECKSVAFCKIQKAKLKAKKAAANKIAKVQSNFKCNMPPKVEQKCHKMGGCCVLNECKTLKVCEGQSHVDLAHPAAPSPFATLPPTVDADALALAKMKQKYEGKFGVSFEGSSIDINGLTGGGGAPTSQPTLPPTRPMHVPPHCLMVPSDYQACVGIGGCCYHHSCFQGKACKQNLASLTRSPTSFPTKSPTHSIPTFSPTMAPTKVPTDRPTRAPTVEDQVGMMLRTNIFAHKSWAKQVGQIFGMDNPVPTPAPTTASGCSLTETSRKSCLKSGRCCRGNKCDACSFAEWQSQSDE